MIAYNNQKMLTLIEISILTKRPVGAGLYAFEPTEEAIEANARKILDGWAAFFQCNPKRSQVLATCCRMATSQYLSSLEELPYFDVIAKTFDFEKREWFNNPHEVDQEAWFYGMSHFAPVLGNELAYVTPCYYED